MRICVTTGTCLGCITSDYAKICTDIDTNRAVNKSILKQARIDIMSNSLFLSLKFDLLIYDMPRINLRDSRRMGKKIL